VAMGCQFQERHRLPYATLAVLTLDAIANTLAVAV